MVSLQKYRMNKTLSFQLRLVSVQLRVKYHFRNATVFLWGLSHYWSQEKSNWIIKKSITFNRFPYLAWWKNHRFLPRLAALKSCQGATRVRGNRSGYWCTHSNTRSGQQTNVTDCNRVDWWDIPPSSFSSKTLSNNPNSLKYKRSTAFRFQRTRFHRFTSKKRQSFAKEWAETYQVKQDRRLPFVHGWWSITGFMWCIFGPEGILLLSLCKPREMHFRCL